MGEYVHWRSASNSEYDFSIFGPQGFPMALPESRLLDLLRFDRAEGTQNLPVWVAPGRCPSPTTHSHFRGVLTAGVASLARELHEHDLVLVIGAPVFRYQQFEPGEFLGAGTTLLHLTSDPAEAARAPIGEAFVAGIGPTLHLIAERSAKTERPAVTARARIASAPVSKGILSHESVFDLIAEVAPSDAVYVDESPSTTEAMWQRLPMESSSSYFFPGAGGLGFGPAALGVQLALPQRRVIAFIGDGSANYSITGLWTAAQHRIPVIFIILKNGVYGALEWFAKVLHAENV
jgi:benzoylformate decarboxylase